MKSIFTFLIVYIVIAASLALMCPYTLCALESRATLVYDWETLVNGVTQIGGIAHIIALWIVQWMTTPSLAVGLTALVLSLITLFLALAIKHCGKRYLMPLALIPSVLLMLMHADPTYTMDGSVAMLMISICLWAVGCVRPQSLRFASVIFCALALSWIAGAIALIFGTLILALNWRHWIFTACPIIVVVALYLSILTGQFPDTAHALGMKSYYIGWLTNSNPITLAPQPGKELTAELMYHTRHRDWDAVIQRCQNQVINDNHQLNYLNLALAEKGQLSKFLFNRRCNGIASIFDTSSPSPDNYMLLSDICYSMGHISLAHKYAFEANEGMGNFSPRMLQRLVDLSIIKGEYAVARKYLKILSSTLKYNDWANQRLAIFDNYESLSADTLLLQKRNCIPDKNHFAAERSILIDLSEILMTNPQHDITFHYLGCMYLLERDVPGFVKMMEENYDYISQPLPKHFQEALAVAALINDESIIHKYAVHPTTVINCRDFWQKRQTRHGTFWQYLKDRK